MNEPRTLQIIIQSYTSEGLADKSIVIQDNFVNLEAAKVKARELWRELKDSTGLPFLQLFISDISQQKNIFYSANFWWSRNERSG